MEDSAMKSRSCLSAFLLTIFLCAFFYAPRNAWTAVPATPSEQSNGTQSSGSAASASSSADSDEVAIPGPLRSFLRMAAISQKVSPEEVLPLLAHHVAVYGYEGSKTKAGKSTEYLTLLERYIQRGKEMEWLA